MRQQLLLSLIVTTAVIGCGQVNQATSNPGSLAGKAHEDIFSDRPIAPRPEVITAHLSNPPLLVAGTKTSSGWVIPDDAKKKLLAEQDSFIAQVKRQDPSAKVLYRFHMVLNAVTFIGSSELQNVMRSISGVQQVEVNQNFGRPEAVSEEPGGSIPSPTSVDFIGAKIAHDMGIDGRGVRVGIIDTGIDYTHAMLGGHGNPAEYASVQPSKPSPLFPNKKVVGGTDLVGTDYDAGSELPNNYIPHPDSNPIDEAGHGTHVAGTVAGIGDGVNTYSGVAPAATLYAIKVFGKSGSTSDAVVIAALDYAADPNGDLNPDDQLDVVNLSLGGDYGTSHILYSEAIKNLALAGTAVVAAAGNSGPQDYVVGAPGTSTDAISVAASVDGSPVNWKFAASQFVSASGSFYVKAVEGPISKPVAQADGIQGKLVSVGLADKPLSDEAKSKLKGNVALILRGGNPFAQKIQYAAEGGAIGVVVMNNAPGAPIAMGGEGHSDIPAIMVSQDIGKKLQAEMQSGDVQVIFKTSVIINEPQDIDTIASFSSKGPRSEDDLIKPEIAAPGERILSAAMGKGRLGVRFDGTSMATPHITGVVALLKQAHPDLPVAALKALLMNNALQLHDENKQVYPISMQGAGRVQIPAALEAQTVATPSVSLGMVQTSAPKNLRKEVTVTNLSGQPQTFQIIYQGSTYLSLSGPASVTLAANETRRIPVDALIEGLDPKSQSEEIDGHLILKGESSQMEIPVMAMRTQISNVHAMSFATTAQGAALGLQNAGLSKGSALPFNLLGIGPRKVITNPTDAYKSTSCNLKTAGYRIVPGKDQNGKDVTMLQFAYELYQPLTTWNYCELNVQFDTDGDGTADLELAGIPAQNLFGSTAPNMNVSVLLNATVARQIRSTFETKIRQGLPVPPPSYGPAMIAVSAMKAFSPSTVAVMQVDVSKLGILGNVAIKVAVSDDNASDTIMADDFLTAGWQTLSLDPKAQGYVGLPQAISLNPGVSGTLNLTRGSGKQPLVLYYPENYSAASAQILQ